MSRARISAAAAVVLSAMLTVAGRAEAAVVYVNAAATGTGTGASWQNAFPTLQAALSAAQAGDCIWVARGIYRPAAPGGDRAASFLLKTGVALYGGFAGTETQLAQRDVVANPTILSGDLNGDDSGEFLNTEENAYHVVVALNVDATAVIDGFTISGGHADGPGFGASPTSQDQGSGINVYFSTPRVENCTFERNWSSNHGTINDHGGATVVGCTFRNNYSLHFGAGLYFHHDVSGVAQNCHFENNHAEDEGGGLYSRSMMTLTVTDCTFLTNRANRGAGMYNAAGALTDISACTFQGNDASLGGGGIYNDQCSPSILGCVFRDNVAGTSFTTGGGGGGGSGGGGIWNTGGAAVIADCGFYHNTASFGGGVYSIEDSHAMVLGCLLEDNVAQEAGGIYTLASPVTVAGCVFRRNSAQDAAFPVGGGMSTYFANSITRNCTFIANRADLGGAGMYCEGEAPVVQSCIFIGNRATIGPQGWGGGVMNGYSAATALRNCLFLGNSANRGGGVFNMFISTPTISNCTIVQNASLEQDGGGGIYAMTSSVATAAGNILWGNTPLQIGGIPMAVSYCCVQGGAPGTGNVASPPRFLANPSPGPDGTWGTTDDEWGDLRLAPGSSCIDAGDSSRVPAALVADLYGDPRRQDDPGTPDGGIGPSPVVDIGAYEFQGTSCYADCEASAQPPVLDPLDFTCFITRFRAGEAWANCDGSTVPPTLNVRDFLCFMNRFNAGCP